MHEPPLVAEFGNLTATALWVELIHLRAHLQELVAKEAFGRAEKAAEAGDDGAAVAEMVAAIGLHGVVAKSYGEKLESATGLDEQELREIVLEAPAIDAAAPALPSRLEVPRLDPEVRRRSVNARSGGDDRP